MLVFDPKEETDDFYFHGRKQARRDLNKKVQRDHKFAFDVVFGPESTNEDVFIGQLSVEQLFLASASIYSYSSLILNSPKIRRIINQYSACKTFKTSCFRHAMANFWSSLSSFKKT